MNNRRIKDIKLTIIDYILFFVLTLLASYFLSVIGGFIFLKVGLDAFLYVVAHKYVILSTILISIIVYIPVVYVAYIRLERAYVLKRLKGFMSAVDGNLENAHFMCCKEMVDKGYHIYRTIDEVQEAEDGIVIDYEEFAKGKVKVVITPEPIHTLVLGTTGSGKTNAYIIPTLKLMATSKTKPSFVITDPKGELNEKTAWFLKEQGYEIKIIDFRHPETSIRWNPLAYAFDKYQKAQSVLSECSYRNGKQIFKGKEYDNEDIEDVIRAEEQRLEDEAYEEILNIVSAICPINTKDPIWDNGAKAFIQAVLIAMLEDSIDPNCNLDIDKYCFYNVAKICNKTESNCIALREYFYWRKKTSLAVQYSGMVLNAPEKQRASYMSSVAEKLLMFNDRGICNMTSGKSEIDVKQMDEKPTACFLVLPDEKEGRHPLGSLFISETYKKLVEKAVENNGTLKRRVYFVMDEYGNLPKIEGVSSMFTVGRSRGIIQIPVIQSYSQIIDKYGAEVANTIFGNCNTEIFIGAKDDTTCEKFSKKLGNYTILSTNVTGQRKIFENNYSESLKERPLMYPRELTLLNNKKDMGNVVVLNQGYSPNLGKFVPCFKSKYFKNETVVQSEMKARALNEDDILYHFEQRFVDIANTLASLQNAERNENLKTLPKKTKENQSITDVVQKLGKFFDGELTGSYDDDKQMIEAVIEKLRLEKNVVKLNQVLRLKTQYENLFTTNEK